MSCSKLIRLALAFLLIASGPAAYAAASLSQSKTATSASTDLEAGMTVTFDIDISNDIGATAAFDLVVTDNPDVQLTGCTLDNVIGGSGAGDPFAGGFTFTAFAGATPNALDPGDSVTLQVSCDLATSVEDNRSYDNHVDISWANTLGGPTVGPNQTSATVSTAAPQIFSAIIATSEAHTSDATADTVGDPRPLVIGENVRYRIWAYVPSGNMVGTTLIAQLPDGLEYISGSDVLVGLVSSSGTSLTASGVSCAGGTAPRTGNELTNLATLGLDCVISPTSGGAGSGDDVEFILGNVTNSEQDTGDRELIVLELNATVVGGIAFNTNMPHQGQIITTNSDVTSASDVARYVHGIVDITATVTPASTGANQPVEYVVTLSHNGASGADAMDVEIVDILPAGMTYNLGAGITGPQIPAVPGTDTCSISGLTTNDGDPNGAGLSIAFDSLALGDVCEVRYIATTDPGSTPGQQFISDVDLTYSTLPGAGTSPNPTGSPPGTDAGTLRSAQTTVTIDAPNLTKSIVSTDLPATADGTADNGGDPRPVAIGEVVRYRLLTQLPEGSASTVSVDESVPAGLAYVAGSARLALVSDGLNITPTPAITCTSGTLGLAGDNTNIALLAPTCAVEPSGGPFSSGTDLQWSLGDLVNSDADGDDEYVLIEYDAAIVNEAGMQHAVQRNGTFDFTANAATLTSNDVFVEVREGQVGITVAATPNPADNRTDTTPATAWDVTIGNTGSTTAFQVGAPAGGGVRIVLPSGMGDISGIAVTPTGSVFLNGTATAVNAGNISTATTNNADDTLVFDQPLQLNAGASLLVEFNAEVLAGVAPGSTLSGPVAVTHASLPAGTSAAGTRDAADQPTGTGNNPITSTAATNDYRTEAVLTLDLSPEAPAITVAHAVSAGPASQGNGTYTLTYTTTITNTGDVGLDNITLSNDLDSTFGAGNYSVTAVRVSSSNTTLAPDVSFTGAAGTQALLSPGASTLPVGDSGSIEIDVSVTPGANLGPFTNGSTGAATSERSGAGVNDSDSTDTSFTEQPEIGTALAIVGTPANNGDGTFTVIYRVTLENSGDVPLSSLQVTNDLVTTFAGATTFTVVSVSSPDFTANGAFDGNGDQNLLDGSDTLAAGGSGSIDITVTVTPGANLGPYANQATGTGTSPATTVVNDTSTVGLVPDANGNGNPGDDNTPTNVTFGQNPEIGLALQITDGPNNNGDGSYTLTYRFVVENTGDTALNAVQITDDLNATFQGAPVSVDALTSPTLTVNPGFNGNADQNLLNGTDSLAVGASATVEMVVTVSPGALSGPFSNSATSNGTSPASTVVTDISDDAAVVDQNGNGDPTDDSDPTPTTLGEAPQIGLALRLTGAPVDNGDGTFTLNYRLLVENTGDVTLADVQVTDDLTAAFPGVPVAVDSITSATLAPNSAFNGNSDQNLLAGTDTLAAGASGTIDLVITITPGGNTGPFNQSATASGTSPASSVVTDLSDDAAVVDQNGNGDPTDDNDPTPVVLSSDAQIGLAKQATAGAPNFDGTFTSTITLTARNTGTVAVSGIRLVDDIATAIAPATVVRVEALSMSGDLSALNIGFDGITVTDLTPGTDTLPVDGSATVTFNLTFNPNGNAGPFQNTATLSGESPGNPTPGTPNVFDTSTDGTNVDPDGNGNPGDDSTPTPVTFTPGTDAVADITDESTPGEPLTVTVTDADENTDPNTIETVTAVVTNDTSGESENVTLTETGDDTGVFTTDVPTDFGQDAGANDDGELLVEPDDIVSITFEDLLTSTGGTGTATDSGTIVGVAGISGNAWLDSNIDNDFGAGEQPLEGWIVRVTQDGRFIVDVQVSADGSYFVTDLPPGSGYAVHLVHPVSGATYGLRDGLTLQAEVIVVDQNLPIDPSGIVYDSDTRQPIAGAVVSFVRDDSGQPLPEACLLPGQQNQTTGDDGFYRFDVILGANPACASNDTFLIVVSAPAGYSAGYSTVLPPNPQPLDPTGLADPLQVGDTGTAPTGNESTDYFVRFTLALGDPNTVWNHIPLDPASTQSVAVRLTKQADQRTSEIGGLVAYTVRIDNTTALPLPGVVIDDRIPAGFTYVADSATTDNGQAVTVSGARTLRFASFDLDPGERRTLRYLLRVGPSTVHGEQINSATPLLGPAPIGNTDTASVTVLADPDFEQTTILGKVFDDRDGDGWQDSATATDVVVTPIIQSSSAPIEGVLLPAGATTGSGITRPVSEGVRVGDIPGRYSMHDRSGGNAVTLRLRYGAPVTVSQVNVTSREGTVVSAREAGAQSNHRGAVKRGLNSQELKIRYSVEAYHSGHEVIISITNEGLNEPGIPGVRLATVEGLLIETDPHGRYHIAGVDAGFQNRGRNYIVKLDDRTLPPGSRVTTENPRVKRLSQGLANQFDFGVQLPEASLGEQQLTVKIAEMFFRPGSTEILPGYRDGLRTLAAELDKGAYVRLRINAYTDPETGDRRLAEQRAQALIAALCELVGRDVSAQISVLSDDETDAPPATTLGHALDVLLGLLVPTAYADEAGCLADVCRNSDGVPVMVIERAEPSVYEGAATIEDQGRVDLIADRTVRTDDGGVIWFTEDPLELTPRLAVVGPSHLPVREGRVSGNASFAIHTNYAAFIDALTVDVYDVRDADHKNPLARLSIDTRQEKRTLYRLDWQAAGMAGRSGERFEYVVTATDRQGRNDRTHAHQISLVDADMYAGQVLFAAAGKQPSVTVRSIDQHVYVFVPGSGGERLFEHVAHFSELGTELAADDLAAFNGIVEALRAAPQVRLRVEGHTSSKPIARRSQHLFADNYVLSNARADVVADFFRQALGEKLIDAGKAGHGPDRPVADNTTVAGLAANRRATATLQAGDGEQGEQVHLVPRDTLPGHIRTAEDQATGETLAKVQFSNDLVLRTIPVYGSRIRVAGHDVGPDYRVRIQGEDIPLDRSGRFAVEYLLPVGEHQLHVDVITPSGARVVQKVPFTVSGSYRFLVALADITVSDASVSGAIEPLAADDHYDDDLLVEGRLAFYLKGKVRGKYLITAQMDTREDEIENLFDDIHRKDPQSLFRRLDPDRYYPVYGDDSTVTADVNSYGRMYARVDWDNSSAVWGNFNTGLTGNELIQYNRGLYGLHARYRSTETTRYDNHKTTATVFGSENQTALGHSEFLGTGGSLYYLRHTDILPGSDRVNVEIRDPATNRVIANQPLSRTADYEVDELQGRIILTRPLMQIAQQSAPSLINDGALDGNIAVMLVDYEYVPSGFDANHATFGARASHWIGDHVGVGLTYVEEGRAAEDYTIAGADITLKAGDESWVKLEYGTTEATQSERFYSTDGGLSFANLSGTGVNREGDAYSVDVHINAADFGGRMGWITNAWYKDVDDQFSIARRDDGTNVIEFGAETHIPIGENWQVGARASHVEAAGRFEQTEAAVQVERRIGERGRATAEAKYVEEERNGIAATDAVIAAAQYEHQVTSNIAVYGGGQMTVEAGDGYDNNDQAHAGVKIDLTERTSGQVEARDGHRGSSILASLEHELNDRHTIYGTVTHSTDRTHDAYAHGAGYTSMLDNVGTNIAAGHRWILNDRVNLFTEGQHSNGHDYTGLGHVFGLDYADENGLHAGLTVQQSDLDGGAGVVDRTAYSASIGYRMSALRYAAKLEYREDRGVETIVQWLSTNRLDYKINDSYRVAAKFNYGLSENDRNGLDVGKLMEGSLGIAHRPVDDNRFNWLAKYTYLYDLQSAGQENADFDRRLQVLSWEGIYKLTRHFDIGAKVARREGEVRMRRDFGPWFDSTANFVAARVRWHVHHKWDALIEGRWLELEESDEEKIGALIAIERHFAENFKLGVGYNFTDFSDDLTNVDFDHQGWFVNAVGKY